MITHDQITQWARDSGATRLANDKGWILWDADLTRFAELVAASERERLAPCMSALETIAAQSSGQVCSTSRADCMAAVAAAAIRNSAPRAGE